MNWFVYILVLFQCKLILSQHNIIFILVDDLGNGDLSFTGNPNNLTPNIDKLFREGSSFTNYYSPASVCSPSRGSILTGKYFRRLGLYPSVLDPYSNGGFTNNITFVKELQNNNYDTYMIGKWHLGTNLTKKYHPLSHGFKNYFGIPMSHNQCHSNLNITSSNITEQYGPCPVFDDNSIILQGDKQLDFYQIDNMYIQKLKQYIENSINNNNKYYLQLSTHHVHMPQYPKNSFQSSLEAVDNMVGEILDFTNNHTDKPIIIFTSDNGATLMAGNLGGNNAPYRCAKGSTWEGGMRVPMAIYKPDIVPNISNSMLITGLDWYSTILSMAGISNNDRYDGYNLWNFIKDGNTTSRRQYFFYHSSRISEGIDFPGAVMAVRFQNYKYHLYYSGGNCVNTYYDVECRLDNVLRNAGELYDLSIDPSERFNLDLSIPEYNNTAIIMEVMIQEHIKNFKEKPSEILKGDNKYNFPCGSPDCTNNYPHCCHAEF